MIMAFHHQTHRQAGVLYASFVTVFWRSGSRMAAQHMRVKQKLGTPAAPDADRANCLGWALALRQQDIHAAACMPAGDAAVPSDQLLSAQLGPQRRIGQ